MAFPETRSLLRSDLTGNNKKNVDSSSDDWSSSYTSGSPDSHHSSDDSFTVEWESYVTENGSIFFLEYNIQPVQPLHNNQSNSDKNQALLALRNDFKRTSTRRSKKAGIRLSNLINGNHKTHKDAMKKKMLMNKSNALNRNDVVPAEKDTSVNKVKFNEMAEGELKEITVFMDPSLRHKFGRRTSVAEALLGISVCPFPDSARIMIAGYMPNSEVSQDKAIKIGDWLKAINNQDINVENFELILLSFTQPTYIKLQLKRIAVEEPPQNHPNIAKATNTSEFVGTLKSLFPLNRYDEHENKSIFSLLYLSLSEDDDRCTNGEDVIFSYPPKEFNCLFGIRGTFLTLNSLFRECTFNTKPRITNVSIQNTEYFVSYHNCNNELLLVAIPAKRTTLHDAKLKLGNIVRNFEFSKQTLSRAFSSQVQVNNDLNDAEQRTEEHFNFTLIDTCLILKLAYEIILPTHARFEESLEHPHYIPLPKEAQLRIDDALSEMEAMDYREWNDEPLKSHREFYILGSAVYFRKYLLASHLPKPDLLDIEAFLRTNGIYLLIDNKPVRELVIWCEIYPKSVNRGRNDCTNNDTNRCLSGRWFLTIVARNQLYIAAILEARHNNIDSEDAASASQYIGPARFYIEELQDTLDHLQTGGVENLANTWINANKRPETILFSTRDDQVAMTAMPNTPGTANTNSNSMHTNPNTNVMNISAATSSSTSTVEALAMTIKNTEVISILKRRNNSAENVNDNIKYTNAVAATTGGGSPSINSQTYSDSSLQKYDDDDDESDSDWDGFPDSQRSSSGFDMSDMTSTFFREISDILSSKLTAGKDNVLFHYVQIETGEGILLAPPCLQPPNMITYSFQKASILIHNILQNTIRFRHLLSQETSTPNMHRSLVAIKEHGILISSENSCGQQTYFWVIGRLFSNPSKELYICHRADVPQNLVEIAFRLVLHSAG